MKHTINSKGVITILAILFLVTLAFILLFIHISNDKTRMMEGETFCLTDTHPKQFLRNPVNVKNVYGYDADGNRINYIIDKDYIVNYSDGTIERTKDSDIPDYSAHKVVYNDEGKFIWIKEPANPELNISYLIYVDYTYKACIEELNPIDNKSDLLSDRTKDKILSGGNIKICLAGDSISVGCDTTAANYKGDNISNSFFGYLKEMLESKYKCSIETYLQSKAGMTRDYLIKNLETIINNKPDVTIIAFGMNDHTGNTMYQEILNAFDYEMTYAVEQLKNNNIDVVLVGFFQQNKDWNLENLDATIKYNEILANIASKENIYFADVYSKFQKIAEIKNLYEDVTGDYIHHPTDWGHELYMTSILPVFNVDGTIKPIDSDKYIFFEK